MISFAGIQLKNPILIASGPLTCHLDLLKRAEDNQAAGASLKLTMAHVPFPAKLRSVSVPGQGLLFGIDHRLDAQEGLDLVRQAKEQTDLVVFGNISCPVRDIEGWVRLAADFEQAGADAIEVNMCCPHLGLPAEKLGEEVSEERRTGAQLSEQAEEARGFLSALKQNLHIPVVPKPDTGYEFLHLLKVFENTGLDGVSLTSVIYDCLPCPDIYAEGRPTMPLADGASLGIITGNPYVKHSVFGKIAVARMNSSLPVIATGGVSGWRDIVEMTMWGATAVGICTLIMWYGFEIIPRFLKEIDGYLTRQELGSLEEIRGCSLRYLRSPEKLTIQPGFAVVDPERCTGCGACLSPGHCRAISLAEGKAAVDRTLCIGCSVCVGLCPAEAISLHREATAEGSRS